LIHDWDCILENFLDLPSSRLTLPPTIYFRFINAMVHAFLHTGRRRKFTLPVLRTLLRMRLIIQNSLPGSYRRKSAWSTGRFNIGRRWGKRERARRTRRELVAIWLLFHGASHFQLRIRCRWIAFPRERVYNWAHTGTTPRFKIIPNSCLLYAANHIRSSKSHPENCVPFVHIVVLAYFLWYQSSLPIHRYYDDRNWCSILCRHAVYICVCSMCMQYVYTVCTYNICKCIQYSIKFFYLTHLSWYANIRKNNLRQRYIQSIKWSIYIYIYTQKFCFRIGVQEVGLRAACI